MIDDLTSRTGQPEFRDFAQAAEDVLNDYDNGLVAAEGEHAATGQRWLWPAALFRRLSAAGVPRDLARTVAADTYAAVAMRQQHRQTGPALEIQARFDALVDKVAAGTGPELAVADYREDIAGWRGDGRAQGLFATPVPVSFADGTVLPDGMELAGIRETGARRAIVAPLVEAGIDGCDAARAAGTADTRPWAGASDVPGVSDAVARYWARIELAWEEPERARAGVLAEVAAQAAIGQFLSLRAEGMSSGEAAAVAAAGDPVAVHAIAGFVQRCRDGAAEDEAELDAVAAATAAVEDGEDYRGLTPRADELPGYGEIRTEAEEALAWHTPGLAPPTGEDRVEGEVVGRFERLARCGMDRATAARLAVADTAERRALAREERESAVFGEAMTVVVDAATDLHEHLEAQLPRWPGDDDEDEDGETDEAPGGLGRAVAESGRAVDDAEAALGRWPDDEDEESCGYWADASDDDCCDDWDDEWDGR
ncbi:hypothetical protein ATK30_0572 [Amycolatopsis echigonensis]|uniref:Uncharacterized protein n=1 Tax=Amycolatopsis echigonensis TaxID=2576905 RepID=A0A2N3X0E3_9PSEU|nr:hypothetical protein [Amycolatopsis niigatensis]PKV99592.1 hypothetical protein ATK30_0572 [Amycolatopsis niigatensis]